MSGDDLQGVYGGRLRFLLTGTPGDQRTAYARISVTGPRGGERASALYLPHNAESLRRFVTAVRIMVSYGWDGPGVTVGYGRGRILAERADRWSDVIAVKFIGSRGALRWGEVFRYRPIEGFAGAEQVVQGFERALAHLEGS
jgi:hypothetical protein